MKKCPFCAEEIQNDAVFCKHCKSSLTNRGQSVAESSQKVVITKPQEGLFLKTLNFGCAIILIIIAIFVIMFIIESYH